MREREPMQLFIRKLLCIITINNIYIMDFELVTVSLYYECIY